MYENLLAAVHETVRRALGADWTSAMEAAWSARIDEIIGEIRAVA
jgi:hypothetical protein